MFRSIKVFTVRCSFTRAFCLILNPYNFTIIVGGQEFLGKMFSGSIRGKGLAIILLDQRLTDGTPRNPSCKCVGGKGEITSKALSVLRAGVLG